MRFLLLAFPLLLSLSACAPIIKAPPESMTEAHVKTLKQEQRATMVARLEKEVEGFSVGKPSPNKAYVFFDPACSFCTDLWRETPLLKDQVEFVWIPVAVMGWDSTLLGAAMLDAANPAGMMSANEEAMRTSGAALTLTAEPSEASVSTVSSNTDLLSSLDPGNPTLAVPLIYYRSSSGQIEIISGFKKAAAIKAAMKLK